MNKKLFKCFFAILFTILFENSLYAAAVSFNQRAVFNDGFPPNPFGLTSGIEFNKDGTKLFVSYGNRHDTSSPWIINEYDLTVPYDISSKVWAGENERCEITENTQQIYDLEISKDGMKLLFVSRHKNTGNNDHVFVYNLSSPYDISTCAFHSETVNISSDEFLLGSKAGNTTNFRLQGLEINDDGSKLFLVFSDAQSSTTGFGARLLEYTLSTPYDLTTISLNKNAGIAISNSTTNGVSNPSGMRFSPDGKRLFITSHSNPRVTQILLSNPYDTSIFEIVGSFDIANLDNQFEKNNQARGIAFSPSGMKMYVSKDRSTNIEDQFGRKLDEIFEYNLSCPFSVVSGNCELNNNRVAIAEAKVELAKRTIDYSTKSTLNRLKWIRRNKEKENLSNLNMNFHFEDPMFNTLSEALISSVRKVSSNKTSQNNKRKKDIYYWSEGNVSVGRDGETNKSAHKVINVHSITYGADKITKNNGIEGIAWRFGVDKIDIGLTESNIESNTFNITYYRTTPKKYNENKFLDTIIGVGLIESDIKSVNGEIEFYNKNRLGKQIYLTLKGSENIKKDNFTLIPSGQFDLGYTKFDGYQERKSNSNGDGTSGLRIEDQHVTTGNIRASIEGVKDVNNDKYIMKSRGKLEYQTEILRTSDLDYSYILDDSDTYSTDITPGDGIGLNHIINGEIGFDVKMGQYDLFIIYERNQKIDYGHTDNIYIALGYLPGNTTEYALSLKGSENLLSNLSVDKNFKNIILSLNLENELKNPSNFYEALINLKSIF